MRAPERAPETSGASPLWARALTLNALSDPRFVPLAVGGLFTALALRAAIEPFGDQDAGWIAAAGRRMIAEGAVPHDNGWSITDPSMPWIMHEWALGPIYAWLMAALGLAGPVVLGMVAAAGTVSLLAAQTIGRARSLAAGALACVLAIALTRECLFEPRPAYVLLGAPLAMAWLALSPAMSARRAAACVALELAWANAHGSFPLGLGLIALGGVSREDDRRRRVAALAGAAAATACTPYGLALYGLVGRSGGGGDAAADAIHAHIAEFQPLWSAGPIFGGAARVLGVALVAIVAALGLGAGPRAERLSALAALVLAGLAVVHARHVPQAVTLGAVLLTPTLDRRLADVRLDRRPFEPGVVARRSAAACALAAAAAIALVVTRGVHADEALGGDALPSLASDPRALGRGAYVAFDASGRYLWLAPAARVLFDPRNDCYPAETALAVYALEEGDCTGACLARTLAPVEVVIVPEGHPATPSPLDFDDVREDGGWHLFVRRAAR